MQTTVQATVEEMVRSPLGKPSAAIADSVAMRSRGTEVASEPAFGAGGAAVDLLTPEQEPMSAAGAFLAEHVDPAHQPGRGLAHYMPELGSDADSREPVFVDDPDAGAAGEYLAGADPGGSWEPEATRASRAEEIPTGPMDAVDYGYDYASYSDRAGHLRARRGDAESEHQTGSAADAGGSGQSDADAAPAAAAEDGTRRHGGVYDAEADGWG